MLLEHFTSYPIEVDVGIAVVDAEYRMRERIYVVFWRPNAINDRGALMMS